MGHIAIHLVLLGAFAGATWLPGVAVERRLMPCPDSDLRWLARWTLGLASWTVVLFLLATLQLFRLPVFGALAVVGGAFGWLATRDSDHRPARRADSDRWIGGVLSATLSALLAPAFLIALGPTVSWDASSYHLTLPRLFLEHGGFREVPMNVYSVWPMGTELLFAPALAIGGPELAKLVHFGFGVLVLTTLWRVGRGVAGWLAATLFLLNGVVLFELKVAYIDLAHAFHLLAAVLFTERAVHCEDPADRRRWLLLGGIAAGLVASVKVTGFVSIGLVGLVLLGPWIFGTLRRRGPASALLAAAPWVVPAVGAWSAWLLRSAWLTGNPVYPFLHEIFGGPYWSAALSEALASWQRGIGMGREWDDYLLLPLRVIVAGGRGYDRFDGELSMLWLVAIPIALWGARRSTLGCRLLGIAGLHFVFWAITAQQSRFLIPCSVLLALATGLALRPLAERLERRGRRLAALAAAVVVATAFVLVEVDLIRSGAQHLRLYLDPSIDLTERKPYAPVFDAVDTLPAEARLLMVNTNQGFFCRRDYLADSFFEASQITDWLAPATDLAGIRQRLDNAGITHILLDRRSRGAQYPALLLDLLRDPSQVEPIHQDRGFVLLALR